jgi:uncharacterized coiled-coil DUF342 family protein
VMTSNVNELTREMFSLENELDKWNDIFTQKFQDINKYERLAEKSREEYEDARYMMKEVRNKLELVRDELKEKLGA